MLLFMISDLSLAQEREIMRMVEWHGRTFCMVGRPLAWVSRPTSSRRGDGNLRLHRADRAGAR